MDFLQFVFIYAILSCLCSPVCDVFLCICQFPIRFPGSSVVLDCIDS